MEKELLDVIVMCGGKCGSSTLRNTILRLGYKCEKYHHVPDFKKYNNEEDLFTFVKECSKNKNLILIDSYRLPIERKISSFFHNLHIHLPTYKETSIEDLIIFFNKNYVMHIEEYHSINIIQDHFKFPRFKAFDFEKKYNIYEKDNKTLIKILFRDIKNWDKILSEIFDKDVIIYNDNISENKDYYDLYMEFLKEYKVPKRYLEEVLKNDEEFKIYNTIEEQEEYLKKWELKSI